MSWSSRRQVTLHNAASHLPEGHLHHRVPVEVEAGDGLSVLQHLHRGTFLWLGFLCGGEELQEATRDEVNPTAAGRLNVFYTLNANDQTYLDVTLREDANSPMVLPFIPVLIHLPNNVDDVSLLERQLPRKQIIMNVI